MASGWVKSLQCKSRAFEDVYHPSPKILIPSASCRQSFQHIKDVVDTAKPKPKKPKPPLQKHPTSKHHHNTPKNYTPSTPNTITRSISSTRSTRTADQFLPSLTDLPEGHPSRNVVEIIFHTSWGDKAFMGHIEMIFKVVNAAKTVARFEEYREAVQRRAGSGGPDGRNWEEGARCVADGNEVMRFQCLGPTSGGGPYDGCVGSFGKGSAIRTFSGSGEAHERGGGGRGRRAMMVCRVIAGRVGKEIGLVESLLDGRVGLDSVSGDNGELFVFDSRAVLPCFLIIYKL